ncbi:MAG: peptidoglycan DD-metalloendopeptidase family protein [Campylobacterales bacterium]|nr:peptidoglycan DD-metalloendopeptidase family protein [Campylobacterales bacterium]
MKYLLPLFIFATFSFGDYTPTISTKVTNNGHTVLVTMDNRNIEKLKLSFNGLHLFFLEHPFKKNLSYLLLPIEYYTPFKSYTVFYSYYYKGKKHLKHFNLKVKEGKYRSERLSVNPSKIKLSKEDKLRAEKEYKEAMKVYNSISDEVLWEKDFIHPMDSKITSPFGTKRVFNKLVKRYHTGIDFRAKSGTPIISSNDGVVRIAKDRFYAGGSVVVDHGQGIYTCYYHMSKIDVKVGDKVAQGDLLGLSGATGRVTGPHLHFSVYVNGKIVSPKQFLKIVNSLND